MLHRVALGRRDDMALVTAARAAVEASRTFLLSGAGGSESAESSSSRDRTATAKVARDLPIASATNLDESRTRTRVHTVLIVEDDRDVAQLFEMLLAERYEVRAAGDGDEALACAIGFVPDVVIVDLGLPGMDGFQVVRRLRKLFGDAVRVVACSGRQSVSSDQAAAAGFDTLLLKPVSMTTLLDAVEGCVRCLP